VALERLLAGAWVNPINKVGKTHHCLTQTNQSYATAFELQSPFPLEMAKIIKP